jgi:hypothetical protein
MSLLRTSGIVTSAGFILYVAAMVVAPQLYNTADIAERLSIIAANQARWNISQLFFALGPALPAFGFLLLAISQRQSQTISLYYLGTILFVAGSAIGIWLVYRQTLDPAAFWEGTGIPLVIGYGFLLLTSTGMLCLGIALLLSSFPAWLGYLMSISAVLLIIATLITRGEGGFLISIFAYLVIFVAGIVIWRQ